MPARVKTKNLEACMFVENFFLRTALLACELF